MNMNDIDAEWASYRIETLEGQIKETCLHSDLILEWFEEEYDDGNHVVVQVFENSHRVIAGQESKARRYSQAVVKATQAAADPASLAGCIHAAGTMLAEAK